MRCLAVSISLFFSTMLFGQTPPSLQKSQVILPQVAVSFHKPFGDLEERFGNSAAISQSVIWKFKNDFFVNITGAWIVGNQVKNKNLFDGILGPSGQIIDNNGNFSIVEVNQRGFYGTADVGFLWAKFRQYRHSGFYSSLGLGYLQHKINVQAPEATVPQLNGEYLQGYDRLTGGTAIRIMHGVLFLSNNRRANFNMCIETLFGNTKSLRSYNFYPYKKESNVRKDILFGGHIGIVLPIFLKDKNEEYFYLD
ncbi:MAG: Uncharacterised protein [Bacteroidetes bacterium MED-G17]|nr:MAG: hypothetical protein CBB99_03100 [Bacteroidetes bacterium TMED39]CAI8340531.1 MAG: Uncharacterised protein [Bacteroidetes bacterium MED-G17]